VESKPNIIQKLQTIDIYFEGMRLMYSYIYSKALENRNVTYFLDKTPRYYLILDELIKIFPEAKFIFLFRNPLAVLNSIINTWSQKNIFTLNSFKLDLIFAPKKLVEFNDKNNIKNYKCNYEEIVSNPDIEIKKIINFLELEYDSAILNYDNSDYWKHGDKKTIYKEKQPLKENSKNWIIEINKYEHNYLFNEYLELLGEKVIEGMGYKYSELINLCSEIEVNRNSINKTYSLERLLNNDYSYYYIKIIKLKSYYLNKLSYLKKYTNFK